jgi:dCMP deaminase
MYISGLFPCAECAKVIIQSGITELVCGEPDFDDKTYGQSFRVAVQMLKESGVVVRSYKEILTEGCGCSCS